MIDMFFEDNQKQEFYPFFISSNMDDKDHRSRLGLFAEWVIDNRHDEYCPPLDAYRDYLLSEKRGLKPSSASSHLSTIRERYKELLRSNAWRDYLYSRLSPDVSFSDRRAIVEEYVSRLRNAIDPHNALVKSVIKQDTSDLEQVRLTKEQFYELLDLPVRNTLLGLRDAAMLALFLCTGVRLSELCRVHVEDLRQHLNGELSLMVRKAKRNKQVLVPYGDLYWCLSVVDEWLNSANITEGFVFRGFYKGGHKFRETHLTDRAVNQILEKYPILINGVSKRLTSRDLRRTYARRQYDEGVEIIAIRDNLGHSDTKHTETYIGTLEAYRRRGKDVSR